MATSLRAWAARVGWHEGRADRAEWRWIAIERLPRTCVGALKELGRPLEPPTHWEGSPRGRVTQRRLLACLQDKQASKPYGRMESIDGACRARPAHPIAGKSFSSMVGYELAAKERPRFLLFHGSWSWNVEEIKTTLNAVGEHTVCRVSRGFDRKVVWLFNLMKTPGGARALSRSRQKHRRLLPSRRRSHRPPRGRRRQVRASARGQSDL
jgi:hypothetical protein